MKQKSVRIAADSEIISFYEYLAVPELEDERVDDLLLFVQKPTRLRKIVVVSVKISHHFIVIDLVSVLSQELLKLIRVFLQGFDVFNARSGYFADLFPVERKSIHHLIRHLLIPPDLRGVVSLNDSPSATIGADLLTPELVSSL